MNDAPLDRRRILSLRELGDVSPPRVLQ
jgi:hypothetical protein